MEYCLITVVRTLDAIQRMCKHQTKKQPLQLCANLGGASSSVVMPRRNAKFSYTVPILEGQGFHQAPDYIPAAKCVPVLPEKTIQSANPEAEFGIINQGKA
jgi:hypothetical protein